MQRGGGQEGAHEELADGELHTHDHGVESEHVILRFKGNAIGRILVRVHLAHGVRLTQHDC